jgi:exopolysaccharide biosynthesis polyprenyl glycosylphosphotransferase
VETALGTARPDSTNQGIASHVGLRPRRAQLVGNLALDVLMLALAAGVTIASGAVDDAANPPLWSVLLFCGLCITLYASAGLYKLRIRIRILDDTRTIFVATTMAAMGALTLRVIVGAEGNDLSAETVRLWGFSVAYVAAGRAAVSWARLQSRAAGEGLRPTLIVGAGRIGALVARRLLDSPQLGLRPVAFLDSEPLVDTSSDLGIPVVGADWEIDDAVTRYNVEQVVVTFSHARDDFLLQIVRRCEEIGIPAAVVPRLFERMPEMSTLEYVGGIPLVSPRPANPKAWQFRVKYALDRIFAATALLLLSPLLLLVALAVRISMGRPIFFRQMRVGIDGRRFEMLKFRSMAREPAAASTYKPPEGLGPGGVEGDDRRTRLGSFLRATSIDELPQLINVLKGEMSLVGPRPERPEFVEDFERAVYRYADRHRVKSGITGWAQVHGLRGRTSLADRAEWDNFYIENFSLWMDAKIALMTFGAVFGYRAE